MAEDGEMEDDKNRINDRQATKPGSAPPDRASARRGFLAGAGAAGIAGAAVLAAGTKGTSAIAEVADEAPPKQAASRGYHETDHIRKYYDTTKV
jgi:hypothetical protein